MRDEQHGDLLLPLDAPDQIEYPGLYREIEATSDLVEQEQGWSASQRFGNLHPLEHSAAEGAGRIIDPFHWQFGLRHEFACPGTDLPNVTPFG